MAHKIEWIEEPWIMRVTYWDRMTTDDIEAVMKECLEAAEKHPINFWVDMRDIKFHDPRLFRSVSLIRLFRHPNTCWFAFTGLTSILQMSAQMLMRSTPFRAFEDETEAVAFLQLKVEEQKTQAGEPLPL